MRPIYLDYAATTPTAQEVAEKMLACLTLSGTFGNAASLHRYGQAAKQAIETARAQVADYLHAQPSEIIWTSGATEANNLAIKGAAHLYQRKGKHIVTMKTEHKSVLDACQHLEKEGYEVTYLAPQPSGLLSLDVLASALRADTILVSIMQVNNETGVIQDLAAISQLTASRGILLHVDAAQSVGKVLLDVTQLPIDLISLCAHKVYGPKGIGALYLRKRPRVRVQPMIHGGGHEQGMRSGTLPTHQIVGMGHAFYLAKRERDQDHQRFLHYREQFLNGLCQVKNLYINGDVTHGVPSILNLRFQGMVADAILAQLPMIAASTASACQGLSGQSSYVLRALGLTEEQAKSSIRFSFGRFTTPQELEQAIVAIKQLLT